FLYMGPILDLIAGIMLHYNYNITISSIVRLSFMFFSIIYLIFKVKNKKINIFLSLIFAYFIIFFVTILITKGTPAISYEIKNLFTTYYFIIMLITLASLYKNKKFNTYNLFIIYLIYLFFVFIPNIFNIGFNSYYESKEGSAGLFKSANVIGSILSILLPIIIINIKKINIRLIILFIINLYVIFSIGTKVPVLSFILVLGINILYYLIYLAKKHNYKILIIILIPTILITALSIVIFPKTSFYKNIVIHINYLEKKDNGHISTNHIIDHFIFSERLTFEEKTRKAYNKSTMLEKVFGIGYIENYSTDKVRLKTVEIDYFDIFYRHGIIGFIIFFTPIIIVLHGIIKNIKYKKKEKLNIILSICLIFILALFQGHILVTPSNSIFAALILALSYNNSYSFKNKLK
ncbi:MAG: O-antigen ligase family protein, partial [Bacilli bacterium]|nr:O-antigen ligase family protein [Bacilli bacterium]